MRFTIPGEDNDASRRIVRRDGRTRAETWRILLRGDRLRGIGRNPVRPAPVHRERVRFGAWEARPRGLRARVRVGPVCHPNDGGIDCYRRVTVYGEEMGG